VEAHTADGVNTGTGVVMAGKRRVTSAPSNYQSIMCCLGMCLVFSDRIQIKPIQSAPTAGYYYIRSAPRGLPSNGEEPNTELAESTRNYPGRWRRS
jgi:hypothetical protein